MTAATSSTRDDLHTAEPASPRPKRSWALISALVLGLALAAAPVAFQMFTRAPKGATMLSDFKPFMTTQRLDGFHHDIAQIDAAVHEVDGPVTQRLGSRAVTGNGYAQLQQQWPTIHADMSDLLDRVQGNLGNYRAVAGLPSFRLFPWFFVLPGLLVAGSAGLALARPGTRRPAAVAFAVLGIGLVAAPVAFQMFSRAPQGGRMMSEFKTIETRQKVTTIQDYVSTMAVGQGAIRLDIEPALVKSGLTTTEVATTYPAVAELDRNWVHILNDMTPMIGAMSDNVDNYQAIKSLPAFPLFPYFFVVPGVVLVGLAVAVRRSSPATEGAS